jgi:acyl-CoA synthetase (AMP-forming)/AMP-acid ligase II
MYRTGDRGRFLPDGQLEVAGRIAFFIKIRGYSVVPSAIEETLNRHPMIATAVVLALGDIGDHEKKLVAYVVGKSWEDIPSQKEMREHCKKNLPPYAVPSLFVPLHALPVSESSRKLDSKKLPSLDSSNIIVEDKEKEISELRAKQGISSDEVR